MKRLAALALATLLSLPAQAGDDVTAAMDEARAAYGKGDMSKAAAQLDYAATLIRQKKAESFKALLPEPLSGWEAGEAQSAAAGAMMFGGGITASRDYSKGEATVHLELVADSPMLQAMLGLVANPAMATMSGGKIVQINGQTAIVQNPAQNPELSLVVAGRILVTVRGNGASLDEVQDYAKAVDLEKLEKL